jgi:hypothetical protein
MPSSSALDPEQAGRAVQDRLEVGDVVVVEVGGEAEPVTQRRRQQPRAGGGADDGERRQLERDRGGPGPLADDDVDAEVLHREVEHLLGGAAHPVDLVEEEHLPLVERGEHRRQVTGVLDGRAAREPQGLLELGRDDHRQGGLAQPGRAREQDVVRWPAAPPGRLEHQPELVTHPWLTRELRETAGAQRGLDDPVVLGASGVHHAGRGLVGPVRLDDLAGEAALARPAAHGRSSRRASRR